MKKIVIIAVILLTLCGGGYFTYYLLIAFDSPIPYPYKIKDLNNQPSANAETLPKQTHLLIVGDRMAKKFKLYEKALQQIMKNSYQIHSPLKISHWAHENEGLHRTIHRLKQLKTFPPVILYQGGSQEFYEKKFFIQEGSKILYNFQKYHDDTVKTLLMALPFLSKFIYKRIKIVPIRELTEDKASYKDQFRQQQFQIGHQLFELELEEFIQLTLSKKSQLILLTTPLNLEALPRKICSNSTSEEIIALQNRVFSLLQQGDFKTAQGEILHLNRLTPGNALSSYLLGQTLRYLGRPQEARPHLEMSTALDCSPWRATAIHNAIIRKLAKKYEVSFFDFDQYINQNLDQNVLFLDDIYPQDLYYQSSLKILAPRIKKSLGL